MADHLCNVQQKERKLQQKTQLRSHRKLAALPTGNDTVLKDFINGKLVFILRKHMFSGLLHHVWLGHCFLTFWRNIPSSFSAFTHNPEDEGGVCSQTVGKNLPDYTVQQPRTSGSITITWWKPQITIFIYVFLTRPCPSFTMSCWCRPVLLWNNAVVEVFIIFACQSPLIHNNITPPKNVNWKRNFFSIKCWY